MSDEGSNIRPGDVAASDERQSLGRIYSLARRSVMERVVVGAEMERRLAVIVLFSFSAERFVSASDHDEVAMAQRCADWLLAKTAADAGRAVP